MFSDIVFWARAKRRRSGRFDGDRENSFVGKNPKHLPVGLEQQSPAAKERGRGITSIGQGLWQSMSRGGPQMESGFSRLSGFVARQEEDPIKA